MTEDEAYQEAMRRAMWRVGPHANLILLFRAFDQELQRIRGEEGSQFEVVRVTPPWQYDELLESLALLRSGGPYDYDNAKLTLALEQLDRADAEIQQLRKQLAELMGP